ncbi:MAG: hypothetical protein FJ027_19695 [Candidatus Rokubacteria bacterium]|nr:hypothetical protein [Candidatus Rokubacteria bacterium]
MSATKVSEFTPAVRKSGSASTSRKFASPRHAGADSPSYAVNASATESATGTATSSATPVRYGASSSESDAR